MHNDNTDRQGKTPELKQALKDPEGVPPPPPKSRLVVAIALSIAIHVVLVIVGQYFTPQMTRHEKSASLRVWLAPKKETPAPKQTTEPKKTVVTLDLLTPSEKPKEAKYLADRDQSAKKERRARTTASQQDPVRDGAPAQKNVSSDNHVAENDSKSADVENEEFQETTGNKPAKQKKSASHQKRDARDPLGIRPTTFGFSQQPKKPFADHLPDVEEGDETQLNAWQWRHAPFFNRIKSRIGKVWSPQTQISRFDPEGTLLGQKDRVTVMSVTIDREGKLTELSVASSSGVAYLDDEAIRAFRVAAPFLFPPKELFTDKNDFSFSFAFHLLVNRGVSFDFDWKND